MGECMKHNKYRIVKEINNFNALRFYVEIRTLFLFWCRPFVNEGGEKHYYNSLAEAKEAICAYKFMDKKIQSTVVHIE